MEKYPARTYENFYKAVKESFIESEPRLDEKEVDRYLKTEEEMIKKKYQFSNEKLVNKEITEEVYWIGRVSAVANCLSLMYEPEE